MTDQPPTLQRTFGLPTATHVVVAAMVGVGILTTSGYIIQDLGSPVLMLALWLVGGVLALCGAVTVAELAAAMPEAGGDYVYVREAYGRLWAFLYGWVSFIIGFSAASAIVAHAAAGYLIDPWTDGDTASVAWVRQACAGVLLIVFTLFHLAGNRLSACVQGVSTIMKVAPLVALVAGGFFFGRGSFQHVTSAGVDADTPWAAMGISLVFIMFSYSGWNAAVYLAGETKDPGRLLPRALFIGCGTVVLLYLLLNLVYVYALDPCDVLAMPATEVESIAALAARQLFGPWIAGPFSFAIGLGLLGSLSAFILVGPRVYYAMARDGLFPSVAARVNPRTQTPDAAVIAQSGCALVLLFSGTFKDILTYAGVGLSLSSMLVIGSVFVLRRLRPALPRPFRTPLYPIPPLLFLLCTVWMVVFAFLTERLWSTISVLTILAGIPVYYVLFGRRGRMAT